MVLKRNGFVPQIHRPLDHRPPNHQRMPMTEPDSDLLDQPTGPGEGGSAHSGRPRDEAREQAILDAAIVVLAEVGYDRMTMDAVAATAKASKATIYRRWPGKAQLVIAAMHRRVVLGETYPDLGSLRAELLVFVQRVVSHVSGLDGSIICGLAAAARNDPELALSLKQSVFDDTLSSLRDVIGRAKARGEVALITDGTVLFEVVPAVAIMHGMKGEPFDEAWISHVTDDIALPLITRIPLAASPPMFKEHA
jgi:AcrR family transcriptional regulator